MDCGTTDGLTLPILSTTYTFFTQQGYIKASTVTNLCVRCTCTYSSPYRLSRTRTIAAHSYRSGSTSVTTKRCIYQSLKIINSLSRCLHTHFHSRATHVHRHIVHAMVRGETASIGIVVHIHIHVDLFCNCRHSTVNRYEY